uniref:Uncharacterized protein n=1 Tax=Knipowitschia caucasica TaxID=637954 RepID=A0AAV2JS73_KNICA
MREGAREGGGACSPCGKLIENILANASQISLPLFGNSDPDRAQLPPANVNRQGRSACKRGGGTHAQESKRKRTNPQIYYIQH